MAKAIPVVPQQSNRPNIPLGEVTNSLVMRKPDVGPLRRFSLADLEGIGMWLCNRMRERYPSMTDKMFISWVRGVMESNEFLFVRTANAVGLAGIERNLMGGKTSVREHFVLFQNDAETEALDIYRQIKSWASGLQASEIMDVGAFSDVPLAAICGVLGRTRQKTENVVSL